MKNKILYGLLSLVIAVGLWLYVVTVVSPGSEASYSSIPVVFQNETMLFERGLMVISDTPQVNLTLSGDRADLNKLKATDLTVTANLAGISSTGTHQLSYNVSFPGTISSNAITVNSHSPDYVSVNVVERAVKTMDVTVEYVGSVPEGYLADKENIQLSAAQIELAGPKIQIDAVEKAVIRVNLNGRTESVSGSYEYVLCDENGVAVSDENVTANTDMIDVSLSIRCTKELKLGLNLIAGGGATAENCRYSVTPSTIQVSGSEESLAQLDELILAEVNLADIEGTEPISYTISLPEGVTNESGIAEASVEFTFLGTRTATYKVRNITAVNVPEGMGVNIYTKELEVTIRGPVSAMKVLSADDLKATVDFTGAIAGSSSVKANIQVAEKYAGVGAVGAYKVTAKVYTK